MHPPGANRYRYLSKTVVDSLSREDCIHGSTHSVHTDIMRQRITFLHKPQDGPDPASLKVTDSSLTGPVLPAVREDRVTLALEELPHELRQVLQSCHELHIRWVSPYAYDIVSPLFSRLPPGFHLFYTPQPESHVQR